MTDRPDVVGLALDEARARLERAGWQIASVTETRPPRAAVVLTGPLRVVRVRAHDARAVELVVTPERYAGTSTPPGPAPSSRGTGPARP